MSHVVTAWAILWLQSGVIVHQPSEAVCRAQASAIGAHVMCIEVRPPCCCCAAAAPVAPVVPTVPTAPMPWQRGEILPAVPLVPAPRGPVAEAQPIPAPGGLAVFLAGLAALAAVRRG